MKLLELIQGMIRGDHPPPPAAELIGFRIIEVEPGRAKFELQAEPRHANPMGTMHGGILCDLADAAMGVAWASNLGEGETFATLELKINFLKPVWTGRLEAVATVMKPGKTQGLVSCEVRDEQGSLVAFATSTCMTLRGEMARGR